MRSVLLGSVLLLSIFSSVLLAQPVTDALSAARASGVCAPFGVAAATMSADGTIRATCDEDATAFVPLLGALGPPLGAGAALALAVVLSGGNATPDTQ